MKVSTLESHETVSDSLTDGQPSQEQDARANAQRLHVVCVSVTVSIGFCVCVPVSEGFHARVLGVCVWTCPHSFRILDMSS